MINCRVGFLTNTHHNYYFSCRDHHKFHHWVKAGIEYADYPYSKFNNKIEAIKYSDEEYDVLLQSPLWTRSETDALMDLAYKFDLRWPVITDRYSLLPPRTLDDLMSRYFFVVSKLKASRSGVTDAIIKNESVYIDIDLEYEKLRRANQEILFRKYVFLLIYHHHFRLLIDMIKCRTKDDEAEEARLKEEIKSIDAAIKRLKKSNAVLIYLGFLHFPSISITNTSVDF
jgi:DNA methyltransferase 1-associated protein 1